MSNDMNARDLRVQVTDLMMIHHALRISANTSMMCGHKVAQKRAQAIMAQIKTMVPDIAWTLMGDEEFCEIGAALVEAKTFSVWVDRAPWSSRWDGARFLHVQIGDQVWRGDRITKPTGDEADRFAALLQELAPLDCERVPHAEKEDV